MNAKRFWTATALALAVLLIQAPAWAGSVLLYDVDFSSPPHTVGLPPAVGDGDPPRNTVTQIICGEPLVPWEHGQHISFQKHIALISQR